MSSDKCTVAWGGYSRIHNRTHRQYGACANLVARVEFRDLDEANRHAPYLRGAAEEATGELRSLLAELPVDLRVGDVLVSQPEADARWSSPRNDGPSSASVYVSWRVTYKVLRPSHIPADLSGLLSQIIGTPEQANALVAPLVQSAVEKGVVRRAEEKQLSDDVALANHLVNYLCKRARKAADDASRYQARLAALQAEYEIEKQTQATRLAETLASEELTFDDAGTVPAHVVRAALQALPAALKNERPGWALGSAPDHVSADDLRKEVKPQ
jgi:hypothetical protein